jgi:hypothetical protein
MVRRTCRAVASYLGFGTLSLWVSRGTVFHFLVPRFPSKSGLIHKHIVNISCTGFIP